MITRRSLFLGAAAIITTPGLLMPVRKIVVPRWFEIGQIDRFTMITTQLDGVLSIIDMDYGRAERTVVAHGDLRAGVLHTSWGYDTFKIALSSSK